VIGEEFASLLAAAQAGNETAFSRLWRDANPALVRYLRVIAPGAEEDIAAETWVYVVRGVASFRGDEQAWRAWLFTTARRRTIDQARHRARRPEVPLDDVTAAQLPGSADSAEAALESLSTAAAIALVSGLPRMQAEVILLRVVAGLDTESVARILRKKPGAVRVAAHRGLRKLAQITADARVTL
jgi:RNA polymerase sigma-70 factor (ECF subfamily)